MTEKKDVKKEIEIHKEILMDLLRKKIARLKKKESIKNARGEVVTQEVKNQRGESLNR